MQILLHKALKIELSSAMMNESAVSLHYVKIFKSLISFEVVVEVVVICS